MTNSLLDGKMDADVRRQYEQERLILWTTEELARMMHEQDLSKADLARALGTSRAYVTNLLSGRTNLTLRTLADVAAVMDYRIEISHCPLRSGEYINVAARPYRSTTMKLEEDSESVSGADALDLAA
jgi:transcriptional regulator with XRE-family HTH domain